MGLLGPNADGELPQPGRVPDCYLGLRLDPPAAENPEVLVVAPAALLHPAVPRPDGTVLYALVTGHPDRAPHELVFLADLTCELRAWPADTWSKVGVDPQVARRVQISRRVQIFRATPVSCRFHHRSACYRGASATPPQRSLVLSKLVYLTLCRSVQLLTRIARGDAAKDLEILVLRRQAPRPRLEPADRSLLAAVSRVLPRTR